MNPIIISEKPRKKSDWIMMKADKEFHSKLSKLVENGIFKTQTDATHKIAQIGILEPNMWKKKIISTRKPKKTKFLVERSRRRKVELEFT